MKKWGGPIPKPKVKRRRAKNNPKPSCEDICRVCQSSYAELHEVFYGPYRQKSIHYGLQVRLCFRHHREGPGAVHNNKAFDDELKREFQQKFEAIYGHEKFMQEFDKNYLDCEGAA